MEKFTALILALLVVCCTVTCFADPEEQLKARICGQPDVRSMLIPVSPKSEKSFSYRYRTVNFLSKDSPTVIYIPGGPGAPSIGMKSANVAKDIATIYTDPRGSGCNDAVEVTNSDISSELIADDILAMIEHLELSNYVIHGQSHGTIVATILSAKLSAHNNVTPPKAIILEGVFGKYWDPRENDVGIVTAWSNSKRKFEKSTLEELNAYSKVPFKLDLGEWFHVVQRFTYLGRPFFLPYSESELLKIALAEKQGKSLPRDIRTLYSSNDTESLPLSLRTWQAITCNEMYYASDEGMDAEYSSGNFLFKFKVSCNATSPRPYDSSNWQILQRIIYFSGDIDSLTPPWHANYHFNHQTSPNKTLVSVASGGHRALQLNLRDCMSSIYRGAFRNSPLTLLLNRCAAPTFLRGRQ